MSDACPTLVTEKRFCPHCQGELTYCQAPPFHVGDGLGWGCEAFYVCFNDECPLYVRGWKFIEANFGHCASYRYMLSEGASEGSTMMVASPDAYKGCIVDHEALRLQDARYQKEKEAVASLGSCVAEHNLAPVLQLLLDEAAHREHRLQACALLTELNDLACVDPLRNHTFRTSDVEQQVHLAVETVLRQNFSKICPHCAEIIKAQAKLCKHCHQPL
ncbi:MAG: zinc ribbon domain-containing protein [Thermodesulfobacteriota bacterium]